MSQHIIYALVHNVPGVLSHISGMFSARGFNINSLTVGETESAGLSRITVVERDLALIKVKADSIKRLEIHELVNIFRAKIVDVSPDCVVIELSGKENKIDALIELMKPFGILELARSGRIAMTRGN